MKFSDLKFSANADSSLKRLCGSIYNDVERIYPHATITLDTADNVVEMTKEVIIRVQVPYNSLLDQRQEITKVQEDITENLVEVNQDSITFK